jgi:hypothetical protein
LSKAAIVGISTGATLMALVIIGLAIYAWKLKKRAEAAEKQIKPFGEQAIPFCVRCIGLM